MLHQAVFDGGDYCHKNPARSLRVNLECGGTEQAWGASEPETCAYVVYATTPAACKTDRLQQLQVCGGGHDVGNACCARGTVCMCIALQHDVCSNAVPFSMLLVLIMLQFVKLSG